MIPPLVHGEVHFVNSLIARAILIVVIDDPTGLQVRVKRYRPNIFEAALLQDFTDFV